MGDTRGSALFVFGKSPFAPGVTFAELSSVKKKYEGNLPAADRYCA